MPTIEDDNLWSMIRTTLDQYPHLRDALPGDYPKTQGRITAQIMGDFENKRTVKYWHNTNLPLLLSWSATPDRDPKGTGAVRSMLEMINRFCAEFSDTPGFIDTIQPLWSSPFVQNDPQFWSVLAACYLSSTYKAHGLNVSGFEQPIGSGRKQCDILITRDGSPKVNIDIVMRHAADFNDMKPNEIQAFLQTVAQAKATKKFPDLPDVEIGVVAVVLIPKGDSAQILTDVLPPSSMNLIDSGRLNLYWRPYFFTLVSNNGNYFVEVGPQVLLVKSSSVH